MFEEGDWVFLKLPPERGIDKYPLGGNLRPRYIGLFEVIKKV